MLLMLVFIGGGVHVHSGRFLSCFVLGLVVSVLMLL